MMDHQSVWAFSLAFDCSTHFEQSFFDLRLRLCFQGVLCNLHLLCVPLYERHTAENLFNVLRTFLDALYPRWPDKLINVATDGENTMTGRHAGVVTRMARCASFDVLRVCCVPHQMDIVAKAAAEGLCKGAYMKDVYSFSVYLRAQYNLITEMGVKCPKKTTRWVHLGRVLNFCKDYCRQIIRYVEEKHPEKLPSDEWWVITFAVAPAIDKVNVAFAELQARALLLEQQVHIVDGLIRKITKIFCVEAWVPEGANSSGGQSNESVIQYVSEAATMRIDVAAIKVHIRDQGSPAQAFYDRLQAFYDRSRWRRSSSLAACISQDAPCPVY